MGFCLFGNAAAGAQTALDCGCGRVAIIDLQAGSPARNALPKEVVIQELTIQGFELELAIDDWSTDAYCLVFRKPVDTPSSTADDL